MQDLHEIKQAVQPQMEKCQNFYSYLSKTKDMSREENNKEAMQLIDLMVERIFRILSKIKLNKMSTEV